MVATDQWQHGKRGLHKIGDLLRQHPTLGCLTPAPGLTGSRGVVVVVVVVVFVVMVMLVPVGWGPRGPTAGGRRAVVRLPLPLGVLRRATGLPGGGAAGVLSPGAEPPAAVAPEQGGGAGRGPEAAGPRGGRGLLVVVVVMMTVDPGGP